MTKKILIYVIVALVLAGIAGLLFFRLLQPPTGTTTTTPGSTSYAGGTSGTTQVTSGSASATTTAASLTVAATTGGSIVVNDFTKDPKTVTSADIPDHYFISGGINAYTDNSPYSIYYVDTDQSFNITILQEPIGDNRMAAEQELMQKLGITQLEMCRLRYYVSVPQDVNAVYAAKGNLGFSFCPGAAQL